MDVFTLDANFDPNDIIDNYETIAWTERYYTFGEFELTTYDVAGAIVKLPINSCISLSTTLQVMVVEEHLIETDEQGTDVLKVSGRSVDGMLDTRILVNWHTSPFPSYIPTPRQTPSSQTASAILYIINGSFLASVTYMSPGFGDAEQILTPVVAIADASVTGLGPTRARYLLEGTHEKHVREMLSEIDAGLKSDRVRTSGVAAGKVALLIYKGRDLRESAAISNYVTFSVDNGDFKRVSYLRSVKNYKNVAVFTGGLDPPTHAETGYRTLALPNTSPATIVAGFARRELHVKTVEIFRSDDYVGDPEVDAIKIAQDELKKVQRTLFITAEISDALKDQYNVSYALGDLITFRGAYGITASMQITEFTFIQDKNGERAYPTLTEEVL